MKIWYGYGSEHSMNLVMIGRFKEVGDAEKARQVLEKLIQQVNADVQAGLMESGERAERYTERMLELLGKEKVHSIAPEELGQFEYDARIMVKDNEVVLTTDEADVSAFLKVLLEKGARIEVYSAHDYPDTGYGR